MDTNPVYLPVFLVSVASLGTLKRSVGITTESHQTIDRQKRRLLHQSGAYHVAQIRTAQLVGHPERTYHQICHHSCLVV